MCGHPQVRTAAAAPSTLFSVLGFGMCSAVSRLQELVKLRNLEHPGDPIQSLLLDMDFRSVVEPLVGAGSVLGRLQGRRG